MRASLTLATLTLSVGLATLLIGTPGERRAPVSAIDLVQPRRSDKPLRQERQPVSTPTQRPLPGFNEMTEPLPAASAPPPPSLEEAASEERRRADALDQRLNAEAPDARWARASEEALSDWLMDFHGASVEHLRCAATLCQLEIAYPTAGDAELANKEFPHRMPWAGEGFYRRLDEEGLRYELYLSREGTTLVGE